MRHSLRWMLHPRGKVTCPFSGREDGVQLRRGHAQQRAYGRWRQVEPGGNGVVVVAFVLQAQRSRVRLGKPVDGGVAVHAGKL